MSTRLYSVSLSTSTSGEHYIPAHMVGQFPELFDSEEEEAA
jgi:hypothetical protein